MDFRQLLPTSSIHTALYTPCFSATSADTGKTVQIIDQNKDHELKEPMALRNRNNYPSA